MTQVVEIGSPTVIADDPDKAVDCVLSALALAPERVAKFAARDLLFVVMRPRTLNGDLVHARVLQRGAMEPFDNKRSVLIEPDILGADEAARAECILSAVASAWLGRDTAPKPGYVAMDAATAHTKLAAYWVAKDAFDREWNDVADMSGIICWPGPDEETECGPCGAASKRQPNGKYLCGNCGTIADHHDPLDPPMLCPTVNDSLRENPGVDTCS